MSTSDLKNRIDTLYFTVSTAGHVDHGKTSLLRGLTGIDPDRLKEEKARQMTTDLGFAHLRLPAQTVKQSRPKVDTDIVVSFVDVPGHGKFLKNMLAGVGGLDMALLVVAADEGPMPQTEQHAKILSALGISRVLLVVTKCDMASPAQLSDAVARSKELLQQVELTLVDVAEVSNVTKSGFPDLIEKLINALVDAGERESARLNAAPFLPIDRVFSIVGYGVVVTGTLVKGAISQGDNLLIEPGNIKARVRGLETFNTSVASATAGQRLAINFSLKEGKALARGQVVVGEQCSPTSTLIVEIGQPGVKLEENFREHVLGQPARIYHGTAECQGAVRWMEDLPAEPTGKRSFIAQITLFDPLIAEPGDRFVLRYGDEGLAGGKILITARPRWITRERLVSLAKLLAANSKKEAALEFLKANPQGLLADAAFGCLLPPLLLPVIISELIDSQKLARLSSFVLSPETRKNLFDRLVAEVENAAKTGSESPTDVRNSQEALRNKVLAGLDRTAFQEIVREAIEKKLVTRQSEKLLPAKEELLQAPDEVKDLADKVLPILKEHICLELEELAKQTGTDKRKVQVALQHLSKEGKASVVAHDFACTTESIDAAHKQLSKIFRAKKDIAPGDFREAVGTSRKYAMALLSYFDDRAITRRVQNGRVLLKYPKDEEV
ncbi:MAG: selenocysteine-specific translation elongation factor [Candidatus Melainabacteria bacterium]|nr:selenocysteine-specific translation elongation factor [Candidatus Melainabacteria bacterium]